jgi:alkanesulfonate monooxygenase SsuD/methylene tetrahydromethanopterin reductase-like flavin-dependent oxidoreductase (luciferase family)
MRFAVDIAPLGDLADPAAIVRLARAAEASGWDGLSIWDSTGVGMGTAAADPFVALSAVATATERLRLILSVVALPRRRPQLVAQAAATLDRLSGGRLVLGVGAGGDPSDFEAFGESFDRGERLTRLDESIDLIDRLLRGQQLSHEGTAYRFHGATIGPRSVQEPRPPMWLGGMRPGALVRSASLEGWIAIAVSDDGSSLALDPDAFGLLVTKMRNAREGLGRTAEPFDIAVFAYSEAGPAGEELVRGYEAAGATWWLESLSPMRGDMATLVARVEVGPPR